MSSTVRVPTQSIPRVTYLRAVDSGYTYCIVTDQEFVTNNELPVQGTSFATGDLFRDMGKTVTFIDPATGIQTSRYRLVQKVNGSGTEGVNAASEYALVWPANGINLRVVRSG